MTPSDDGLYECQISTEPKMSHYIHLKVVGKCFLKDTYVAHFYFFAAHGCLSKMLTFDFFMTNVGGYQMSGKEMSENKWPDCKRTSLDTSWDLEQSPGCRIWHGLGYNRVQTIFIIVW